MAAALSLVAGIAGCGGADDAEQAVVDAARKMRAASVREMAPAPSMAAAAKAYADVGTKVKPALSEGLPGQTSAAGLISARATAGLALAKADEAAAAARRAAPLEARVRAGLDGWLRHQGQAAALEQFDPSRDLAAIDAGIKEKVEASSRIKAEKQSLDDALARLESQARELLERSRAERERESALRQQAVNAGAVERASLITRANEHRRASDGYDKEASLLRAQAAARAPESRQMEAEIERLTEQSRLLGEAKASLAARRKASIDQAAAEKAAAAVAAQAIRESAAELVKVHESANEPSEQAARLYGQAATAAKAAGGKPELDAETKSQARLAGATYKHAQADVLLLRADRESLLAATLRRLAEVSPPLPDAATFAAQAADAAKQADEHRAAAKAAYEEAKREYEGIPGRPDLKERLSKIGLALDRLSQGDAEVPAWLARRAVAGATAPSGSGGGSGGGGGSDSEVRRAIESMLELSRSGDFDRLLAMLHAATPADEKVLALARRMAGPMARLDAACKDRFGSSFQDLAKEAAGAMGGMGAGLESLTGGMGLPSLEEASIDDLDITMVDATTAKVSDKGGSDSLTLRKIDGAWKIEIALPEMAMAGLEQAGPVLDALGDVAEATATDIKAGKFATPNEMMTAFQQRVMAAAMKAAVPAGQRPPRGGGAGGGG
jgi:hypothetical protein